MSVGNWQPATEEVIAISAELLQRFSSYSESQQLQQLNGLLSDEEIQRFAALMKKDKEEWFAACADCDNQQLQHLMRFFTVAEQLPGWQSDDSSPVIWLGKLLKKRGNGIPRELALWIKAHSDNKYLPHGPLL